MFDNGLLKYYKQNNYAGGFINTADIGLVKTSTRVCKATRCFSPEGVFYLKYHNNQKTIEPCQADAEILLSQIYNRIGIASSVYLPAKHNGKNMLLCNDVSSPSTMLAADYMVSTMTHGTDCRDFLNPEHTMSQIRQYFTPQVMAQQAKLRILDTASFHTDRHECNFFYKLQTAKDKKDSSLVEWFGSKMFSGFSPTEVMDTIRAEHLQQEQTPPSNLPVDVVAIDFESSGVNSWLSMKNSYDGIKFFGYQSDFQKPSMERNAFLQQVEESPVLEQVINKTELAEEIGTISPIEVSKEIYEVTGYQVSPEYAQFLERSYDNMAETLLQ